MTGNKSKSLYSLLCLATLLAIDSAHAGCNDRRAPGMDWSGCKKTSKMLDDTNFKGSRFDDANLAESPE